ncbi:MAG: tetratricopeptide repeat protein [Acidobacteria bacterium]|nr:tetratricopeptide repeat protein [Acidobacteriota bacterium]
MHSKRSIIVWLAVLLLAVPGLVHADRQGRLIGKVVDLQGNPVEGVTVLATAKDLPEFHEQDKSNKKGMFIIDIPQLGVVYLLRFDKIGYAPLQAEITWDLAGTARKEYTLHPAGAVEVGTQPLPTTSNDAVEAYNAGVAAFKAKDYPTAAKHFQAAVAADAKLRQGWEALSLAQFEAGNYKEAAAAADKAVALGATKVEVLRVRWESYNNLGDQEKAAAALKDMEKAGQQVAEAKKIHNEAVKLVKAGDDEGALQKFKEALQLDPNLIDSLDGLADTALKLGHNQEAADAAEKALAEEPKDERALRVRYNAYLALGDKDKLVGALVGLAAIEPEIARHGLLKLAFDAYDANDLAKAKDRFAKYLRLDPKNPMAQYYVGITDMNLGDNAGAINHLQIFLQLAPNDKEAPTAQQLVDYLKQQQQKKQQEQ